MDRFDVLFVAGVALIAIGAGLAWLPAGLMVAGAGLVVLSFLGAKGAATGGTEGAG